MTEYVFFSGKGGVGKTTMACATAIHFALEGKQTLIITTDPASNLADVFEQEIGHKITPIKSVDNLHAMEIDPDEATLEYKERIIGPFREIMPADAMASLEEQFKSPCTTEIASFDRFVDFMDGNEYEVIVFDTAPTGHTIRLLELPVEWSKFIETASKGNGQTCLGPVQAIQESKSKYDQATALLRNPERTTFVLVMRPEQLSLYETHRAAKEMENIGIVAGQLIINGILPEEVCSIEFFRKQFEVQQRVIQEAEKTITSPKRYMLLRNNEVKGISALRSVAAELFHGQKPSVDTGERETPAHIDPAIEKPDLERLFLPAGETKVLFFTGKGGVGKTTISSTAALYIAQKGFKTLLVTTDPAAHLGEVFDMNIGSVPAQVTGNLYAAMIDAKEAFRQYKEKTLNEAREKYSEDMLAAMEEELNSPCTEEMATFERFAQFLESKEFEAIVFDTAPTGHTLRLLDLPFDYAKQVEMMIGTGEGQEIKRRTDERFKKLIEALRDKKRTVFNIVLYPEATPIMEAYRAMLDLKEAGMQTQLVVANMVLPKEVCTNDFFLKRRRMQVHYLEEIKERFELPILQFPMMSEEMKGLAAITKGLAEL